MDRHLSSAEVHNEIGNQALYDRATTTLATYNYDIADQAMNAYWTRTWATSIAFGC